MVVIGDAIEEDDDAFPPSLGVYDPQRDSWENFVMVGLEGHSAVLTETEIIVWGGTDHTNVLNEGLRITIPVRPL